MAKFTAEQSAAIESRGNTIVSASAGSGKTTVMIEKLTRAVLDGTGVEQILAVTFTKKAAAQMKDKLRDSLIKRVQEVSGDDLKRIKAQIAQIPSADISTIHSFCSRLLRTYFYALDIDGEFDIMAADDAFAKDLQASALDILFERKYEADDGDFIYLVKRLGKKCTDSELRRLLLDGYNKIRNVANYRQKLEDYKKLYTDEVFCEICDELWNIYKQKLDVLSEEVEQFRQEFEKLYSTEDPTQGNYPIYQNLLFEMQAIIKKAKNGNLFSPASGLTEIKKPRDCTEKDKEAGEKFKKFKGDVNKRLKELCEGISDEATERERFFISGRTANAFCDLLLEFDSQYAALKRDENKLDYNDLEHLTLQLLQNENVRKEINAKYKYVYVDEYQDVNPVQEEIISKIGQETFLVGDVKQAIYGFRGSKSAFFTKKFETFNKGAENAITLPHNFRSHATVLNLVNDMFSGIMNKQACDIDYVGEGHEMIAGSMRSAENPNGYPDGCGTAEIHIFGKDEKQVGELGVYSVMSDARDKRHSREGLAVLKLVERELQSQHYDLDKKKFVDTQCGDICILTRKSKHPSTEAIVRTLTDAGYSVSGSQESNICNLPEVKKMLDILSLIDNPEQDIPLASSMLSPLGGFSENELAQIRIAYKDRAHKYISFRQCVKLYRTEKFGKIKDKLDSFFQKIDMLRDLAEIMTAGELINYILAESGLEAAYSAGNGEKLKNVLTLAAEGPRLTLSAFLEKIKAGDYNVSSVASATSNSIQIMTMHGAKGLEFPVVILGDICRKYKGMENSDMLFDDEYGFAFKSHDSDTMMVYPTVLMRYVKKRTKKEELKNELNVFYVACTRAKSKLHILSSEKFDYSYAKALSAENYAQLINFNGLPCDELDKREEVVNNTPNLVYIGQKDENTYNEVASRFEHEYSHADSIELPVKSSASAILKSLKEDEPYYAEHSLFTGEGETSAERGIAYHRFLELCDFSVKSLESIKTQLLNFEKSGKITPEQAELLNADELFEIVNMPVFADIHGAELYREQEFLCRLKACEILDTTAEDYVLIQGAIDLLVRGSFGVRIIDYKYSHKTDEELIQTYSKQLDLYKKAVSAIWHVPEKEIGAVLVNIRTRRQVNL